MSAQARLAVLIDADNAQADLIEPLLAEVATFGVASVKRIYGDWTQPNLNPWKTKLIEHAIQPIQQFRYTTGKNATDSALIIDAMDLLYTGRFEGFCLVSSDSDFTRLATRLRESGLTVYGFGERKTPASLIKACDKFIYVDILRAPSGSAPPASSAPTPASAPDVAAESPEKIGRVVTTLLGAAVDASAADDGWAHLGQVGQYISKQAPDFDPRRYGEKRLSDLFKVIGKFVLQAREAADGKHSAFYVRRK